MKIASIVLVLVGTVVAIYALVIGARSFALGGSVVAAVGLLINASVQDREDGL